MGRDLIILIDKELFEILSGKHEFFKKWRKTDNLQKIYKLSLGKL